MTGARFGINERDLYARFKTEQDGRTANEIANQRYHNYLYDYIMYLKGRLDAFEEGLSNVTLQQAVPLSLWTLGVTSAKTAHMNGAITKVLTAFTQRQTDPPTAFTKGAGKVGISSHTLLTGAPLEVRISGNIIDRSDGSVVAGSETLTISEQTIDGATIDAHGNTVVSLQKLALTANWFVGACTIEVLTVGGRIDGDLYHTSFEQWNDSSDIEIDTLDMQLRTTSALVDLDAYLYAVVKRTDGAGFDVTSKAHLTIDNSNGAGTGDKYHRVRLSDLAVTLNGATDGHFVAITVPSAPTGVQDLEVKVWGYITGLADVPIPAYDGPPTGSGGGGDKTYIPVEEGPYS